MYNDTICSRCGSPRKISESRKETIELYSGKKSIVMVSQITCTNKECQAKFDEERAREVSKNNARKAAKQEQDEVRKTKLAQSIANARKGKAAKQS